MIRNSLQRLQGHVKVKLTTQWDGEGKVQTLNGIGSKEGKLDMRAANLK
jgi:hypothetical protein